MIIQLPCISFIRSLLKCLGQDVSCSGGFVQLEAAMLCPETVQKKPKLQLKLLGRFFLMVLMPLALLIVCVQSLCKACGCPQKAMCEQKCLMSIWSNKAVIIVVWDPGYFSQ